MDVDAADRTVPGWSRLWPLAAVTLGVVTLAATGIIPHWSGLIHLVALPPLDLFADFRILLVEAASWADLALRMALVLTVRIVVLAYLLGGVTRRTIGFAACFYAVASVPLLLAAFLDAAAHAVLYARLFWPAVAAAVLVTLACAAVPWQGRLRLRGAFARAWRHGSRIEVVVPYLAAIVALGAVAESVPKLTLALVAPSAFATALALRAMARPPLRRPQRAVGALLLSVVVVAALVVVTRPPQVMPPAGPSQPGSLLVVSGVNSASGRGGIADVQPHRLGYACDQVYYFSYAGAGDGQPRGNAACPIRTGAPFGRDDTHRPFAEQVDAFAEQAADLPRPLTVVAHSHATWVVWEAIATGVAPADTLILIAPFPDSVVGYQPAGENGAGRVLGDLLRGLASVADLADFNVDPDAPAALDLLAPPNVPRQIVGQELPAHVRTLAITAVSDLPLSPGGWRLDVERDACPKRVPHPDLPTSAAFYNEAIRFLGGESGSDCPAWPDWTVVAARPFGVPAATSADPTSSQRQTGGVPERRGSRYVR